MKSYHKKRGHGKKKFHKKGRGTSLRTYRVQRGGGRL